LSHFAVRSALARLALTVLLLLSGSLAAQAATLIEDSAAALAARPTALQPEREMVRASQHVLRQLQSHYRQLPLDAAFASRVFDEYLKSLDDQRIYFYAADISELEGLRSKFERAVRLGELEPPSRSTTVTKPGWWSGCST